MKLERSAGILLHPTSLPSKYGIGDFGDDAYKFVDLLSEAGQTLWQVLPLGPTGYGNSPYQCYSAFAGNHFLISPDKLIEDGLLNENDIDKNANFTEDKVDFENVIKYKMYLLEKAFKNFDLNKKDFLNFVKANKNWLEDYSLFMACKKHNDGDLWARWPKDIAFREPKKIKGLKTNLKWDIDFQKFLQYIFTKQWLELKNYANKKGIKIIGDLPIYVAYDSADVWANKELFSVGKDGKLLFVAGVPPDYFSKTGQLWGNPLYKWKEMEKTNFEWWIKRFQNLFKLVDVVRIDHFRGFDAYWEVPGGAPTAEKGRWVKAPGDKLFTIIKKKLPKAEIIAEDLGVITKEVEALRDKFEFPGIKILQFAFGENGDKKFLPHRHIPNCLVHTGSHDNDTTRGFFENEKAKNSGIYEWTQKYLNYYGDNITFQLIKNAYMSVAKLVVIPMQDVLNLRTEARMNLPGTSSGNWEWRFKWEQVPDTLATTYKEMCEIYERPPKKIKEEKIKIAKG